MAQIPHVDIWQAKAEVLQDGNPAHTLWKLLQRGCWPADKASNGVGSVIAGKLLAAKRPGLIPIYDRLIADALQPGFRQFWSGMWTAFQDPELREELQTIKGSSGVPPQLSLLRMLDIVIWIHQHEKNALR